MAQTTIGRHRCQVGNRENDRPFVVEWDATDLASFEARAHRDVVFVKVNGCDLRILDCRDDGVPGRYGTYGTPQWTSGSVEGFDVHNEGDLYTRLPLGVASLSAQVHAGQTLHLKYFVSGTTSSTRNLLYRGDIASNALCESATHFVASFDLGAFEITASQHGIDAVAVGMGNSRGGGGLSNDSSRLRQAGSLASCTADTAKDLSRCKAPIRLQLRAITESDAPDKPLAVLTTQNDALASRESMEALVESAGAKARGKDGMACLADLDRAAQLDSAKDLDPKR
ncbi:MAG: hypothetical protein ABTD50_22055, partial [Polyangiaceae bacterium]